MGSQLCKGGVDDSEDDITIQPHDPNFNIDSLFPVQSNTLSNLDWSDELVIDYRCKANCQHNHSLGKMMRKYQPRESKLKRTERSLKFSDDVEQRVISDNDEGGS